MHGRITPAYAGKSSRKHGRLRNSGDHPRLRGEKPALSAKFGLYPGSPPLTRGKGKNLEACEKRSRITPAYAGKRAPAPGRFRKFRDHPRLRGEKSSVDAPLHSCMGSPPLTRGKVPRSKKNCDFFRHPRCRGEYTNSYLHIGSPPLPRRKLRAPTAIVGEVRRPSHRDTSIIPAAPPKRNFHFSRDFP